MCLWCLYHFYSSQLPIFTARRYAYKRGLCCGPVSVRPSVCHVHAFYLDGIVKLLCRPGSPIILVFCPPAPIPNSKGNLVSGGAQYKKWENLTIFDWNRRLSRKRYEIGPWLLWNVNRKSYALYRMMTFSMTLTDPNPFSRSRHFWSRISQKRCV